MLDAIGVESVDELFAEIPAGLRLDGALDLPDGLSETECFDHLAGARRAQRRRRRRALLPRRRDVRPLRAGARRRDHPALRVPDPVHAVPARGLPGRAAGDVRVPDRDLGAHRAAGRQRLAVRGPVVGRLGRLPGARRDRKGRQRWSSRAACTRTAARRSRTYARGFGAEVVEVGLDGGAHRRRRARATALDSDDRRGLRPEPQLPRRGRGPRGAGRGRARRRAR